MKEELVQSYEPKEEPFDYEDCFTTELKPNLFDDDRLSASHVFKTEPEATEFVDATDIHDNSTTSVKVEEMDPLCDIKHEPDSCFLVVQQSGIDNTIKNSSSVVELSKAVGTRSSFQHLEIPGDLTIKVHQLFDAGSPQPQCMDGGMPQAVPSIEISSQVTSSILQLQTSDNHSEDHSGSDASQRAADAQNKGIGFEKCQHSLVSKYIYQCFHCEKCFKHDWELNNHLSLATDARPYRCSLCDKSFTRKSVLIDHSRSHTGDRPYRCSHCDKAFTRKCYLNYHLKSHGNKRTYQCSLCSKHFAQKRNLTCHLRLHNQVRPYKCSLCEKSYTQKSNLSYHLKLHTGERPYQCSECDKAFIREKDLIYHFRMHSGDRPYRCEHCKNSFTRKSHLHFHMRIHTGERPYNCCHCDKGFIQKNHLIDHMSLHSRERRDR